MTTPLILIEHPEGYIQEIILNRPEKRNALNTPLLEQLCDALEKANANSAIRAVVIRGNGSIFCAGMDLAEAAEADKAHASAQLLARMFLLIAHSPHITIAAVHGVAVAGGAGIMAACDVTIAAEGTQFGFPETRRGLVPAQVLAFLTRQLRQRDLRELLLLGELIDTKKALSIGLINKSVPLENLMTEVLEICRQAKQCAPKATAQTKQLIDILYPSQIDDDLKEALRHHETMRQSDEAKEGICSFLENRPTRWSDV